MTNNRIDVFQSLYGHVLRTNKGNPEAMSQGVRAILNHYSSTNEHPQHYACPRGDDSWCKYQVDLVTGGSTYRPVKEPIAPTIYKIIEPIFEKLGNKQFLESCKNIVTSNSNESYHHLLWGLAPKEAFCSAKEVEMAVYLSVCVFNSGFFWTYENVLRECGFPLSNESRNVFRIIDTSRILKSDYHSSEVTKQKRKKTRREKNKLADAFQKTNDYQSGAFHAESQKESSKKSSKRKK